MSRGCHTGLCVVAGMMLATCLCGLCGCVTRVPQMEEGPLQLQSPGSESEELVWQAGRLYGEGHWASAEALYRAVLATNALHARAANNLAYVLVELGGDLHEAELWSTRALTIEPDNPRYLDTAAVVRLCAGREREAIPFLERAHARAAVLPLEDQRTIVRRLVDVYQKTGQGHLARQISEDYTTRDPDVALP